MPWPAPLFLQQPTGSWGCVKAKSQCGFGGLSTPLLEGQEGPRGDPLLPVWEHSSVCRDPITDMLVGGWFWCPVVGTGCCSAEAVAGASSPHLT